MNIYGDNPARASAANDELVVPDYDKQPAAAAGPTAMGPAGSGAGAGAKLPGLAGFAFICQARSSAALQLLRAPLSTALSTGPALAPSRDADLADVPPCVRPPGPTSRAG